MGKNKPYVSFVIPTIGRDTLNRTIDSVRSQIDHDWECIVMVDQDAQTPYRYTDPDNNIRVYDAGAPHHESVCRNLAVSDHVRGEWVAFVDDDDTIDNLYVVSLKDAVRKFRAVDVVIFKQTLPINRHAPEHMTTIVIPNEPEIVWGNVGVSYAVRTKVIKDFPFKKSKHEDLLNLVAIEAAGYNIMWSNQIMYYGWNLRDV